MHQRSPFLFRILALLLPCLLLLYCQSEFQSKTSDVAQYDNLKPNVKYMGMQTCRSCHNNIHESFIHTGMGKSFNHATLQKTDATFGKHALVYDKNTDFYYYPFFKDSVMYIQEFRLEGADTIHNRMERISYIVGSGQHTNSHIVDFNGYVFQAPITFYTQDQKWDMAPGFEKNNERFDRLLASECITCHNHFPVFDPQSMNKYAEMPTGIECERCHGPGEVHVKEKLAGNIVDTTQFIDYSIVNPRDLPRDLQMDLCQRCHLQGVAVLNEGKTFFDFKPGMALAEVMNVFLPRYTNSHERFIMASQADRLRQSECYINSEMTCITCHNPHQSVEVTGNAQYNDACKNCHGTATANASASSECSWSNANASDQDCSGCHMPPSGSIDIPHINITDHWISRNNTKIQKKEAAAENGQFLGLKLLTKDQGSDLEMAKGYLALYDKYVQNPIMLDSAFYYLNRSKEPLEQQFKTLIHYYFIRENHQKLIEVATQLPLERIHDGWTAYRIGEAYLEYSKELSPTVNQFNALKYFQKAVDLMPAHLDFQEKLGNMYFLQKKFLEAKKVFEYVLSQNRKRPVALNNLGFLLVQAGNLQKGENLYDEAIALDPDYENALLNKASVLLLKENKPEAKKMLERVQKINPNNTEVNALLLSL